MRWFPHHLLHCFEWNDGKKEFNRNDVADGLDIKWWHLCLILIFFYVLLKGTQEVKSQILLEDGKIIWNYKLYQKKCLKNAACKSTIM